MPKTSKLPSLHQLKNQVSKAGQEKTTAEKEDATVLQDTGFTVEELGNFWKEFARTKKAEGKNIEYIVLNQPFALLEQNIIELEIANPLQEEALNGFKSELLVFLRNKLKNDKIGIKSRLVQEAGVQKPYTPREKFNYLAAKNPALQELKQRLGLDTDF